MLATIPFSPATAAPATITTKGGKLSPRLVTLASRGFATAHAQAKALSLPESGTGSLVRRPGGRILVDIRTDDPSAHGVSALRAAGAQIVNVSRPYQTVTAAVTPGALSAIAADPAVRYVMEVLAPHVGQVGAAAPQARTADATPNACAPIVSEGDSLMNVAAARAANHVDGSGETVGILSDSFNAATGVATNAAQDVANGDLPGPGNPCGHPDPVDVVADGSGPGQTDEGRGMAQLVHDLAPSADLTFSTVDNGELAFANQITALRTQAHASVIVDDAFYPNEPFFQDGPIANAARAATAAGVPYFSAAGNANVIVGGSNVASYEAPAYRAAACPTPINFGEPIMDCHDFDPTAGTGTSDAITVAPGGGFDLDLQWAEPRGAVTADFDLFVVNSSGTVLAASAIDNPAAGQPVEFLGWGNASASPQTVRIVVAHYSGSATPRLKFAFIDSGGINAVQYATSNNGDIVGPAIFGHSGTTEVGSTAAIPYDDSTTPEDYSSRGPVTHYFQPTPSTTALGSPDVIDKPDFAATDGVRTSFFAEQIGGVWRFYGTSAAAPQAAAIGALLRSKDPLLTPAQVITTLHDTARSVANNGTPDAAGGGYLDAGAALASVTAIAGAPRSVHASPGDGQATVSWTAPASNGGTAITGYAITPYINNVAQSQQVFNSPVTTEAATGLSNATQYTFRVSALNGNGAGPLSDATGIVNVGAPTKPTGVAVTAGGESRVTLKWVTPASTNGSTLTGYTIVPFLNGAAQTASNVGVTSTATVTGLVNGDSYTFEVAATSNRGDGQLSDPTAPFTVGLAGTPTNVAAAPGNGSATVTYRAPPPNGTHIIGYTIVVYEGSVLFDGQNYPNKTKQTVLGLTNGHTYKFRVYALTNGGQGPASAFSKPIVAGTPIAPGAPRATPGNGRVTLHWTASASNGATVTKYVVSPVVGGVAQAARTYGGNATGATITGLKNGKSFAFKVKAVNARGSSAQSSAPAIVIGAPGAPTKVSAKSGHAKAILQWTAPTDNGSPITGYAITPYRRGVAQKPRVFHSKATTETVTGLGSGDTYSFVVAAINARGTGPHSAQTKAILIN